MDYMVDRLEEKIDFELKCLLTVSLTTKSPNLSSDCTRELSLNYTLFSIIVSRVIYLIYQ